ncbi:hypothetical protein AHAS_Ahas06G0189300 [Arachis hypogaea]
MNPSRMILNLEALISLWFSSRFNCSMRKRYTRCQLVQLVTFCGLLIVLSSKFLMILPSLQSRYSYY